MGNVSFFVFDCIYFAVQTLMFNGWFIQNWPGLWATRLEALLYIMPSWMVTAWLFTKTRTQRVFFLGLLPLVAPAPLFVVLSAWCHLLMGPFEVAEVERKAALGLGSPACLELFNVGRSSRRLVQNVFLCLSSLSFISKRWLVWSHLSL